MTQRKFSQMSVPAILGLCALAIPVVSFAQTSGVTAGPGARGRSTDERVNTEAATPPPVNSDYRRAAEGTLPQVPGQLGAPGQAVIPGRNGVAGAGLPGQVAVPTGRAMDPAAMPFGNVAPGTGVVGAGVAPRAPYPVGMDVAMMIEHAVDMGIDGSLLLGIASANKPGDEGNDSVAQLMKHARNELDMAKQLLVKAGGAGTGIEASSPVRRFYGAANNYMTALDRFNTPGAFPTPNNQAQLAMINHAVKAALDGNHIAQMAADNAPLGADPLQSHGRMMRDEGMKTLEEMGGTTNLDPSAPPSPVSLAQSGRDLVNAATEINGMMTGFSLYSPGNLPGAAPIGTLGNPGNGLPVPGQFQDNRPEIVGGTYGTGSPTAGTATGAEAARDVKRATEGPNGVLNIPTPTGVPGTGPSGYGVGNNNTPPTNSTGGLPPR